MPGAPCYDHRERGKIHIRQNRIYVHQVMRVNYTTYDMRRDQDSISLRTHPDIMILAPAEPGDGASSKHPYRYARVYGIFHVEAQSSLATRRVDARMELRDIFMALLKRDARRARRSVEERRDSGGGRRYVASTMSKGMRG